MPALADVAVGSAHRSADVRWLLRWTDPPRWSVASHTASEVNGEPCNLALRLLLHSPSSQGFQLDTMAQDPGIGIYQGGKFHAMRLPNSNPHSFKKPSTLLGLVRTCCPSEETFCQRSMVQTLCTKQVCCASRVTQIFVPQRPTLIYEQRVAAATVKHCQPARWACFLLLCSQ
jgi:hypothetical protein